MATYKVKSKGVERTVSVVDNATGGGTVTIDGRDYHVELTREGADPVPSRNAIATPTPRATAASAAATPVTVANPDGKIVAPIPGLVISIDVKVGDWVSADQVVLRLEAMKMENDITSPIAGVVKEIAVSEGSDASLNQLLVTVC